MSIKTGLAADRPTNEQGRRRHMWVSTDTNEFWVHDGTEWVSTEPHAAMLNQISLECGGATFTGLTAETGEKRVLSIQLLDRLGENMASKAVVDVFFTADAAGEISGYGTLNTLFDAGDQVTGGGEGVTAEYGYNSVMAGSNEDGQIDVEIQDQGDNAGSVYAHVRLPSGSIVSYATPITFIDNP